MPPGASSAAIDVYKRQHQTDVDSEVIANLIARRGDLPLAEGIEAASRDIRGSYALVVICLLYTSRCV